MRYILCLSLLLAILFASDVSAAQSQEKVERYGNWVLKCRENDKKKMESCLVTQALSMKDNAKEKAESIGLVGVAVGYGKKQDKPQIAIYVPPKADQKTKLSVQIDKKVYVIGIDACSPKRCLAQDFLADNILKEIINGKILSVTYKIPEQKKPLNITLPLQGFSEAWKALQKYHKDA